MFIELGGLLCTGKLYKIMCVSGLVYFRRQVENDGPVLGAAKSQKHVHDVRSYRVEESRTIAVLVTLSVTVPYRLSPSMMYDSYYNTDE